MRWLGSALAVLLAGCATAFPPEVMRGVDTRVTAEELGRDPLAHRGERVIVGGEILATQPRPGETRIELLARRLQDDHSPERSDRSPGRLLLRSPDFLDPAVYAPGRRITVVGTVTGAEEGKIGELPYRYPTIAAERIRLWPKEELAGPAYYPWAGWPYGPYYPYGWWW
jgi:outer membrane lipoprotein